MKTNIVMMLAAAMLAGGVLAEDAYLFAYFKGERDGLHLAWSEDGLKWTALNGDRSLLKPVVGKDRLLRDPSICQGPDGIYHMVWTSSWHDRIIGYANSKDLIHWSQQRAIPVMEHEQTTLNCWAPEITYDDETGEFFIYWASTIPGRHSHVETSEREKQWNHRIYLVTTKDFVTFTPARLWFNPSWSAIDSAIIRVPGGEGRSRWMMAVKNENSNPPEKNIRVTFTEHLKDGFPVEVSGPILDMDWVEGPAPLAVGGDIYIYFDAYTRHKYMAVKSSDGGKTWTDVTAQFVYPKGIRHGTAFRVDKAVVEKLKNELPD